MFDKRFKSSLLTFFASGIFCSFQAAAILPLGGANLIFQERPTAGVTRLVVYEWNSAQWGKDGSYQFDSLGFLRLIPFPGAKEFAFLEPNLAGLDLRTVSSLGIQQTTSAQALGSTFDGYPIELTEDDCINEYLTASSKKPILSTLRPSIPAWGTGRFHQIGQFRNREYVLAGDQAVVAFDAAHASNPLRITWSQVPFETQVGSGKWHRIQHVKEIVPSDRMQLWVLAETDLGSQVVVLADLMSGKILHSLELNAKDPSTSTLIHDTSGQSWQTHSTGSITFRTDAGLRDYTPSLNHVTNISDYFDPAKLMHYKIPAAQFASAVGHAIPWNWKANYSHFGMKNGARAQNPVPPPVSVYVPPLPQASPPPQAQTAPVSAPVSVPALTPTASDPLDALTKMPAQLSRKAFLRFYKNADADFRNAFQTLLTPGAANTLRRLGFERYHTTIECVGDDEALITRDQILAAYVSACANALKP